MIRVMIYTNEPLTLLGLQVVFRSCDDIELSTAASDTASLLREASNAQPDVLLLSVESAVPWDVLSAIGDSCATTKLVLWLHEITPELAYQAMRCGVRGILRKSSGPDMIPKCIRKINEGELWFEKGLLETFVSGRTVRVSRRESQLITYIAQGLKNKEIASVMAITEGTVKVYLSRLFEKLAVRDRYELALFGLRSAGAGLENNWGAGSVVMPAATPAGKAAVPRSTATRRLLVRAGN